MCIQENVEFVSVPEFFSVRHRLLGDEPFVMPEGTKAAFNATAQRFPQHREALKTWFDTLENINGTLRLLIEKHDNSRWWLLNGFLFPFRFWPVIRHDRTTVGGFLQKLFGDDERVKLALCANINYYSDTPEMSLLFFAAAQASFHRRGNYIRGGSKVLVDYLVNIIRAKQGVGVLKRPVVKIIVEEGNAVGVVHTNRAGEDPTEVRAPVIFGNAAPAVLTQMLPEPYKTSFVSKYGDESQPMSLWTIYLGLDRSPCELGVDCYSNFIFPDWMGGLKDLPLCGELLGEAPKGRIPPYVVVNYDRIDHGLVHKSGSLVVITGVDYLSNWEALDEPAYAGRKAAWMEAIIGDLVRLYPRVQQHIVFSEMATAKTVNRYLKTPGGAVYGYSQSPSMAGRARFTAKTSLPGLYLASAYARPGGGYSGAMLAGQNAFRSASKSGPWR